MSLPDTLFIFVLALIIFGPKKLPEIGRQLGKLVGEFRRASNEFKFQIEEELRQADWNEKRSSQPPSAATGLGATRAMDAISSPVFPAATDGSAAEASTEPISDAVAVLPVGQHPNIDSVNPADLSAGIPADMTPAPEEELVSANVPPVSAPVVAPAEGTQPRSRAPHTPEPASPATDSAIPAADRSALQETETAHG